MLSHEEQTELLAKTRDLWNFLIKAEPSMVDGAPFSAATLIRTADYHAHNAAARSAKILDILEKRGEGK